MIFFDSNRVIGRVLRLVFGSAISEVALVLWVWGYLFLLNGFGNTLGQTGSAFWVAVVFLWVLWLLAFLLKFCLTFLSVFFSKVGLRFLPNSAFLSFFRGLFLSKVGLRCLLAVQILVASVAVFAKFQYGVTITTDLMLSALLSEVDLTLEMVSLPLLLWLLGTAFLPILWVVLVPVESVPYSVWGWQGAVIFGLGAVWIGGYFAVSGYNFRQAGNIRDSRFVADLSHFSPLDVWYHTNRARRAYDRFREQLVNLQILSDLHDYRADMDSVLVVWVIGETTRGDHFGLNGYLPDTTPRLRQLASGSSLYSFGRATSCDTLTVNSLYCMASTLRRSDRSRLPESSSFAQVLHSLGFGREIYALQTMSVFYHYLGYDKLVSKYQVLEEQGQGAQDKALLPYAREAILGYTGGRKLLVLHTLGSHQTYADRFDRRFERFVPFCKDPDVVKCSKGDLVRAFDNSVLAVDDFVASVIEMLQTHLQDKKVVLFYVADHGESLGEGGHYFHGEPVDSAPKEQFSVPFVVWFSKAYLADKTGQKLAQNLHHHWQKNQAVSHDHLFHSLLGCAGVSSKTGLDQELNLCGNQEDQR